MLLDVLTAILCVCPLAKLVPAESEQVPGFDSRVIFLHNSGQHDDSLFELGELSQESTRLHTELYRRHITLLRGRGSYLNYGLLARRINSFDHFVQ